jgi:hypothetical protein
MVQFFDPDKLSKSDTLTNPYPRERKLAIISGSALRFLARLARLSDFGAPQTE